jgi:hypothetical protein
VKRIIEDGRGEFWVQTGGEAYHPAIGWEEYWINSEGPFKSLAEAVCKIQNIWFTGVVK